MEKVITDEGGDCEWVVRGVVSNGSHMDGLFKRREISFDSLNAMSITCGLFQTIMVHIIGLIQALLTSNSFFKRIVHNSLVD